MGFENWFVVGMGISVVFVGLICIVILCAIISAFFKGGKQAKAAVADTLPAKAEVKPAEVIENRQEIIAAVTAACAEEMGTDIKALRVLSFKKL